MRYKAHHSRPVHAPARAIVAIASLLFALCSSGCIGPAGIRLTRCQYNETVKHTNEQELLLNLVRLRYNDSPQFIGINAITAQFAGDSRAGVTAEVDDLRPRYFGTGDVTLGDRPTISYTPVQGPEFTQAILRPLALETMALLWEFNWEPESVLRLVVERLNGLDNAVDAGGPVGVTARQNDPTFRQLLALLRNLQERNWISLVVQNKPKVITSVPSRDGPTVQDAVLAAKEGFRLESQGEQINVVKSERRLSMAINPQVTHTPEIAQLSQMLRLQQGLAEYPLTFEKRATFEVLNAPYGVDTVEVSTRSVLEIGFYLSKGVMVPEEHFACGLAPVTYDAAGRWVNWPDMVSDIFSVHACKSRPKDKLRVKYRGYWYYIADNDHKSRNTFLLFLNILALERIDTNPQTPLLTIPI